MASMKPQRRELLQTLLLLFFVIAEAIRSKSPLPKYLPNPTKVRAEILQKFVELPQKSQK
jgi:hypothetical protein